METTSIPERLSPRFQRNGVHLGCRPRHGRGRIHDRRAAARGRRSDERARRHADLRDICRAVRALGGDAVGLVGDPALAQIAIDRMHVGRAPVDVSLHDKIAILLIRELASGRIPSIPATGCEDWVLPRGPRGSPQVEKPVSVHALQRAVERLRQ